VSVLFTDNTILFKKRSTLDLEQKAINNNLGKLEQWFKINKLTLNIAKTKCEYFRNIHKTENIKYYLISINSENILSFKYEIF